MSNFQQGGADFRAPKQTKTALKTALKNNPREVMLYSTSMFSPGYSGPADQLPEGMTFTVVGPDPHNKRDWYANVKRNGDRISCT